MKYRVLIVDDDSIVAESYRDRLEELDIYLPSAATDPNEALRLAAEDPYDAYLVDQRMPQMSGEVFIRKLLTIDPDPLVYVISAVDDNAMMDAAKTDVEEGGLPIKKYVDKLESNKNYLFSIDLKEDIKEHKLKASILDIIHLHSKEAKNIEKRLVEMRERITELRRRDTGLLGAMTVISGVNHELNNINAIFDAKAGMLDYLSEDLSSRAEQKHLDKLMAISEGIRQTTERFSESLSFMRFITDERTLGEMGRHDVGEILNRSIETLCGSDSGSDSGAGEGIRDCFILELEEGLDVYGSAQQLEHAFYQILRNAIEAVKPDKAEIRIKAVKESGMVRVGVRDNGRGLTAEELDAVFLPFYRQGKIYGGKGGSIAHKIITHNHKGEIRIESEGPGKGAEVTIRLPAQEGA